MSSIVIMAGREKERRVRDVRERGMGMEMVTAMVTVTAKVTVMVVAKMEATTTITTMKSNLI